MKEHCNPGRHCDTVKFIEENDLCYHLGSVVENVVCSVDHEDVACQLADLRKACYFLCRHIEILENCCEKNQDCEAVTPKKKKA